MMQKRQFSRTIKKQTLAEQVAETIKESILAGEWSGGEVLPTEPELAEQFQVSRTVVRDATRMLVAQGLVEAQHGRGVFVTDSQVEAFGDALLLALRRAGASVWDVEHFEQLLYPELFAEAVRQGSAEEKAAVRDLMEEYLQTMRALLEKHWGQEPFPAAAQEELMAGYRTLMTAIFGLTHNQVIGLVYASLLKLRTLRHWEDEEATLDEVMLQETTFWKAVLKILDSGDPQGAREMASRLMLLPVEAEAAMRRTPIGEVPVIPISLQSTRE